MSRTDGHPAEIDVPYTQTALPGSGTPSTPVLWVDTCGLCGALVVQRPRHTDWHNGVIPPAKTEGDR